MFAWGSVKSTSSDVASQLANHLYLGRKLDFIADRNAKIKALTPDQVMAAARTHLKLARWVRVQAGDLEGT